MQRIFSNGGIKRNLLGMVFILAIMLAVSANTMAAQHTVGTSGTYDTIQEAANNSADGDTIIIVDSVHTEAEINVGSDTGENPFSIIGLTIKGYGELNTTVRGRFVIRSNPGVFSNFYNKVSIQDMTICDGISTDNGGGIYNFYSDVTLTDCTVSGNSSSSGGGIYSMGGPLTLTNCTVSGNSASDSGGGVFFTYGTATFTDCTVSGNSASGSGGGIYNSGQLTLTDCTMSENSASDSGGGIHNEEYGTATLTNCTVSGNDAEHNGGGIYSYGTDTEAKLTNCTVSENDALSGNGGGICTGDQSSLSLTNCTVNGNSASGDGGGIYRGTQNIGLRNTIVANNTIGSDGSGPDILGTDLEYDIYHCLIEDPTGINFSAESYGNITGQDPMLGALGFNDNYSNGTYTHALMVGSMAINAGTSDGAPETDQRDLPRIGNVDIGAYEYQGDAETEAPIVSDIQPNPVPVDTAITLTARVDDSGTGGRIIISAEYSIDGGGFQPMTAQDGDFNEVTEVVEASMDAFTEPGVHDVCVRGTDAANNVSVEECILLAVHEPVGFVSGGGWITSPEGAYVPNSNLTGKANFGFVSKYKKGASEPTGQTEFQFKVASLNFHSSSYKWLVVANHKAQYKGVGNINNAGNYGFMLSAIDAALTPDPDDVDMFRIKIWDKDSQEEDNIVYDNQMDAGEGDDPTTAIGGGNIKIHTVKAAPPHSRFADHGAALPSSPTRFRLLANYPNPFNPETWLPYELAEDRSVTIRIYSTSGRLVRLLDLGHRSAGFYTSREKSAYWDGRNESGESVSSGIYFYQIQAGEFSATRKMTILK